MKIKFAAVALIPFTALILLRATVHAQPPTKSIWDGVYSDAQAARGKIGRASCRERVSFLV